MKRLLKKIRGYIKKIKHMNDKYVIVSFGENCLTDNILSRNDLKSFSTPYSSGRSNIEYILAHEKEHFNDFLNSAYLEYELVDEKKVPRNKKYVITENKYHESCSKGFEFTHHDVISDKKMYNTIQKRCNRMLKKSDKKLIILYHHRFCEYTNRDLLISHLLELKKIYENRYKEVIIYLFSQTIVTKPELRKVESCDIEGIKTYLFYTLNEWAGKNQDIFWARCDNDLIKEMIDDIKNVIK